jgi:alpha-glucosidase
VLADAPLDGEIPVYARGGAIIPSGPVQRWMDERPLDPLTLQVYPDPQDRAEGLLYEDDGTSLAYRTGAASTTRYDYRDGTVTARRGGGFTPARRGVRIRVPGRPERGLDDDSASWEVST